MHSACGVNIINLNNARVGFIITVKAKQKNSAKITNKNYKEKRAGK